jgi:hypothetical protein
MVLGIVSLAEITFILRALRKLGQRGRGDRFLSYCGEFLGKTTGWMKWWQKQLQQFRRSGVFTLAQ